MFGGVWRETVFWLDVKLIATLILITSGWSKNTLLIEHSIVLDKTPKPQVLHKYAHKKKETYTSTLFALMEGTIVQGQ